MSSFGVSHISIYLPKTRIAKSTIQVALAWSVSSQRKKKGYRAIASHDEDAITMSIEAARAIPNLLNIPLDKLSIASSTLPFADRSNSTIIGEALSLHNALIETEITGSLRCSTRQLIACTEEQTSLCIASDTLIAQPGSPAEQLYGDAGAAIVMSKNELLAECLGCSIINADLVDHYRMVGEPFNYQLEGRWLREEGYKNLATDTVIKALEDTNIKTDQVDYLIANHIEPAAAKTIASTAKLTNCQFNDEVTQDVGFCGNAHPYIELYSVLSQCVGGEIIVLCGIGQGCDAIILRATKKCVNYFKNNLIKHWQDTVEEELSYIKYLASKELLAMDWGLRAERDNRTAMTSFYRNRHAVTSFQAGQCTQCFTVQYPKSNVCVNPECHSQEPQTTVLMREAPAYVKSFTEDWLAYNPIPPLIYGNVQFANGANIIMEYTDCQPGVLKTQRPLKMVFRIKDVDKARSFKRYCWKATLTHGDL